MDKMLVYGGMLKMLFNELNRMKNIPSKWKNPHVLYSLSLDDRHDLNTIQQFHCCL